MAPTSLDFSYITELKSPVIDSEPDLFYYNFGNYSGKFVFDKSGVAQIMPDTQFNLAFGTNPQAVFVITDTIGTKYYFNKAEGNGLNVTSWYLTKIISADGSEEISFEYALEQFSYWMPSRTVAYVDGAYTTEENTSNENVYISTFRLSKINTNFGVSVDFVSGANRIDYFIDTSSNIPKATSSIEIKYNNVCVKKFKFDNEFVETDNPLSSSHYLWSFYNMSWANKRMYLKGITETSCNESISKKYEFNYWGRLSNGKDQLPNKMSYAQDHWGYNNGKVWNSSLRPSYSGNVPIHYDPLAQETKTIAGADRSSAFSYGECGTLKSITYPTGGKTLFEYEANYGYHEIPGNIEVGGLRISKITDWDVSGKLLKTKRYEYESGFLAEYPDYTDGGKIFTFPDFINNISNYFYDPPGGNFTCSPDADSRKEYKLIIHSGSVNTLGATNGYHINYKKVKEIEEGNGYTLNEYNSAKENYSGDYIDEYYEREPVYENNLFQRYNFKLNADSSSLNGAFWSSFRGGWPYAPSTDYSWKRGLLKAQYFYKEGASLPEKSIINEYTYSNLKPVYGVVWKIASWCGNEPTREDFQIFFYGNYKIQYGVANLTQQTITENGVSRIINSEYNEHQMISKTTETSSDNKTLETIYKYPKDFSSQSPYSEMVSKNIIAPVIEEAHNVAGQLFSKTKTSYKNWSSNVFLPEFIQAAKGSNSLENRIQYHSYYANGNVKEISKTDGTHEYYIWGYQGEYPIAKIENFTASQATAIQTSLLDPAIAASNSDTTVASENTLRTKLNEIRNNTALSAAMVTTYTYDPLIGVTSVTDSKGNTTYYEYDEFNRLKQVKDKDGKILSANEYHYKN